MGRQNVLKGDAHVIEAIDQWIADIEHHHGGAVRIVLHRHALRRRLSIRVELCDVSDTRVIGVRVRRKTDHPNGDALDLCGTLLRELGRLDAEATYSALNQPEPNVSRAWLKKDNP